MSLFRFLLLTLLLSFCDSTFAAEPEAPALMLPKANRMADVANTAYTKAQIASLEGRFEDVLQFVAQADNAARSARNYADAAKKWLELNSESASESDVYSAEGGDNAAHFAEEIAKKVAKLVKPAREAAQREAEAAAQREAEAAAQREAEAAAQREAEAVAQPEMLKPPAAVVVQ